MKACSEFSGLINCYKPKGVTSTDCVNLIKRLTGARKVGHGGTLDPFAEGVLPIGINRGTKQLQSFLVGDKSYSGIFKLGYTTDTLDLEGKLLDYLLEPVPLNLKRIQELTAKVVGTYDQTTPKFSARKVKGKRLYKMARQQEDIVETPKKTVTVHDFRILDQKNLEYQFEVSCSKGTYVRQLIQDLLATEEAVATLEFLKRDQVGPFYVQDSISIYDLYEFIESGQAFLGPWWEDLT